MIDETLMNALNEPTEREKETQAQVLVRIVIQSGAELFHNADREAFARVPVDGHYEVWPVKSKDFRLWLAGLTTRPAASHAVRRL